MGDAGLHPPAAAIRPIVALALAEDVLPLGDLTSALLEPGLEARARLVARARGVVAGTRAVAEVCRQVDDRLSWAFDLDDGDAVEAGGQIGELAGPLEALLVAERCALNFLCHLSGVATLTRRYVEAVAAVSATTRVWDTRKTTPGMRALEKAAVRAGGGWNHRGSLSEAVLVKDNHLAALSIAQAVERARRRWPGRMVEVECDRLEQVHDAAAAGATIVLCDNMSPAQVGEAVGIVSALAAGTARCLVEASGGITLENVAAYAAAGADLVSIGALTHSAPILDIGLDLSLPRPGQV